MTARMYFLVTALLFTAIGLLHGLRLVYAWEVTIDGDPVGVWPSWAGLIVATVLAGQGFRLARR